MKIVTLFLTVTAACSCIAQTPVQIKLLEPFVQGIIPKTLEGMKVKYP